MTKVGLVSLGCAQNRIDSEIMIAPLQQAGMAQRFSHALPNLTPEVTISDWRGYDLVAKR